MNRYRIAAMLAAAMALAGCGTSTAAHTAAPSAAPRTATLAPAKGPFSIKMIHCGIYTSAEKDKFGTNAAAGIVSEVTNHSNSVTAKPQLTAEFLNGATVDTQNYSSPAVAEVAPGQSEEVNVDNLANGGSNGNPADTCEIVRYTVSVNANVFGTFTP